MKRLEKIIEYLRQAALGARNIHFFRINNFPRLFRSFSELEKKILLVAVTAIAVCGAFLVTQSYLSGTKTFPDFGGKYVEGLVGQPRFINPVLAPANSVDMDLSRVVYSGVLKFDADQKLAPDLAEGLPELSADQKQYTVHLRREVFWHDGQKFSADDVIFTIQLISDPAFGSPLRLNWNKVEVQKIDDYTFIATLKEPYAAFPVNLTLGVLPKHIWEGTDAGNFALSKFNLQPIGTGPFKIKGLSKTEEGVRSIALEAFNNYHLGRPFLDDLEFKFFSSYDDLISAYHSRAVMGLGYIPFDKKIYVEKSSNISQHLLNLPQYQALFFNTNKSPVLRDKNVRAALAESLNRQAIIDEVYLTAAQAAYGPIPEGYLGHNTAVEKIHPYDLEHAKKLLDEAGFKTQEGSSVLKKGDVSLEFTIVTNNFLLNEKTAEFLKKQWEAIGFKVNLQILTIGELEQNVLRPREYEALLFSENIGGDPDPLPFWHSTQRGEAGLNLAMFNNKEADTLLTEGRSNADSQYREKRYQRFEEILANELPAIFLVNPRYVYGVSSKVGGIELNNIVSQSERFLDIHKWFVKTKRVKK
ncbi:MAG: peptide ABC transporter substrate-binding protein [Patescibacteria group bacterium]